MRQDKKQLPEEIIEKHFKKFESPDLRMSAFSFFMATGKVNGTFLLTMKEMMEEYSRLNNDDDAINLVTPTT